MDRKSLIALIIVAIILFLTPYYQEYILGIKPEQPVPNTENIQEKDSTEFQEEIIEAKESIDRIDSPAELNTKTEINDSIFTKNGEEKFIVIETDLYKAKLSNSGGGNFKSFVLKNYAKYDSTLVNMIDPELQNTLTISFQETNGQYIDLKNVIFEADKDLNSKKLTNDESFQIEYVLSYQNSSIKKKYIFYNGSYHIDLFISFENSSQILLNSNYQVNWINGLPSTESYVEDDNQYKSVNAFMGGELESFTVDEKGETDLVSLSGKADWIALRTKYFIAAISNINSKSEGIYFKGLGIEKQDFIKRIYDSGYFIDYSPGREDHFRIYLGPLDHRELGKYNNNLDELIMNNGWYEEMFRWISLLILPVLEFFHSIIPNYGIVIIIFSIIVKIIVYPLTKSSYKSMKKMQSIQPMMQEVREKYKNDPQRQQKEMMKMYQKHGFNPLGGCLPMLLQMPLLIALFIVFRSTIQLRGATFIPGWINDLSQTDTLFHLPFSLPFYGDEFNLLPILMALTMFFQSKMTMQDPKQKFMVFFMPVFMLLLFNRFPAGLNLYYAMFNLLTIIQQKFIKTETDDSKDSKIKGSKKT